MIYLHKASMRIDCFLEWVYEEAVILDIEK